MPAKTMGQDFTHRCQNIAGMARSYRVIVLDSA